MDPRRLSEGFLLAVGRASRGHLKCLDVSGHVNWPLHEHPPLVAVDDQPEGSALLHVVSRSPRLATLRLLCPDREVADAPLVAPGVHARHVFALLAAAPSLTCLDADVCVSPSDASFFLTSRKMRVRRLISEDHWVASDLGRLARDMVGHTSLRELALLDAPLSLGVELDALVSSLRSKGVEALTLFAGRVDSRLGGALLTRLLVSPKPPPELPLVSLTIYNGNRPLLFACAGELPRLCKALGVGCTLTSLTLASVALFDDPLVADALLDVLTGHAHMAYLSFFGNEVVGEDRRVAAGRALARLLVVDSPALLKLMVGHCSLRSAGLVPLLKALRENTHLLTLVCDGNDMDEPCATRVLLPAVIANASLRCLVSQSGMGNGQLHAAGVHAEALVAARSVAVAS